MPGTQLTLVMPSSVFLDDDIDSLLGARHGKRSDDEWLGILLVPEPSWSPDELATAVRNVKKRAQASALVIPPAPMAGPLETLARQRPDGGTIVLAWPRSAEEGLSLLRHLRESRLEAATSVQPTFSPRQSQPPPHPLDQAPLQAQKGRRVHQGRLRTW